MDKRVPPCDARRVNDLKRAPRPKPVEQARAQEPAAARERSQHTTQQTLRPREEGRGWKEWRRKGDGRWDRKRAGARAEATRVLAEKQARDNGFVVRT